MRHGQKHPRFSHWVSSLLFRRNIAESLIVVAVKSSAAYHFQHRC
jgi:hypothetical protein